MDFNEFTGKLRSAGEHLRTLAAAKNGPIDPAGARPNRPFCRRLYDPVRRPCFPG
jgi:hypothetical protein